VAFAGIGNSEPQRIPEILEEAAGRSRSRTDPFPLYEALHGFLQDHRKIAVEIQKKAASFSEPLRTAVNNALDEIRQDFDLEGFSFFNGQTYIGQMRFLKKAA
jgi:hypothetical protein